MIILDDPEPENLPDDFMQKLDAVAKLFDDNALRGEGRTLWIGSRDWLALRTSLPATPWPYPITLTEK